MDILQSHRNSGGLIYHYLLAWPSYLYAFYYNVLEKLKWSFCINLHLISLSGHPVLHSEFLISLHKVL